MAHTLSQKTRIRWKLVHIILSHSSHGSGSSPLWCWTTRSSSASPYRWTSCLLTHSEPRSDTSTWARAGEEYSPAPRGCVVASLSFPCLGQIVVTVWRQEEDRAEAREHGYLTLLQLRSPAHTFKQDLSCFKAQGTQRLHHEGFSLTDFCVWS